MDKNYYLALSLKNQTCVIIGFGEVGQRKLTGLLATDVACINIFDKIFDQNKLATLKDQRINCTTRQYQDSDLLKACLVFACTNDQTENLQIASFCQANRILCNCTSQPDRGQIIIPATIKQDNLTLTLSTAGASPALSRKWRAELSDWLAPRSIMVKFMATLRPYVLALGYPASENRALFHKIVNSPIQNFLIAHDRLSTEEWLTNNLPKPLQPIIKDLLTVLDN